MPPSQLETTIREIAQDLQELPVSPHVRELRAKAVTYGRVVGSWSTYAPTPPQVQAMIECVAELQEKVVEAKHDANRDVSKVTRKHAGEPKKKSLSGGNLPLPPGLPPSLEWSASVPDTSLHARNSSKPVPGHTSRNDAPTLPPPAFSTGTSTIPPVSAPRAIDGATPVPALLRTRRSR